MVGLLPEDHQISWMMRHGSFYLIGTMVLMWSIWLFIALRGKFRKNLQQHYPAIILAVCLTGVIFYNSPPRFKILADETNLMGVSMLMHHSREAALPLECHYTEDGTPEFYITDEKRPFLYPFLVSLLHSVFGYSPSNGFVFNFIISIGALFGAYLAVIRFRSRRFGLIAMILMAGTPVYIICSTSGGFELLNAMMVIYCIFLLSCLSDTDFTPNHTEFLLFSMVLLAHCRYESVILIPVIGFFMIPHLIRQSFFQNMSYWTMGMPIFFLPILWQRKFFMDGRTLIIRSGVNSFEKTKTAFGFNALLNNLDDNIFVLTGVNPNYGFSAIIFVLALIGGYFLIKRHFRIHNLSALSLTIFANVAVFGILLIVISSFHWGNFGLDIDNRLSLVLLPFLIWAAIYSLSQISIFNEKRWILFIGLLAMLHFFVFSSYGKKEQILENLALPYEYNEVCNYLKHNFSDPTNTLIITEQPNLYVIQKYAAIQFTSLDNYIKNRSRYKQYKDIVAVHKIRNSKKTTSHVRWEKWHITSKPLTVLPVAIDFFIQIESWHIPG